MANTNALMTSNSAEWGTPPEFFAALHQRFQFSVDAAASDDNALLPTYWTKENDGLSQDWGPHRVFLNPPYGKTIVEWCKKAVESRTFVVMLIPARPDTAYWHKYIIPYASGLYFIQGRLAFVPSDPQHKSTVAPFPSVVVVFDPTPDMGLELRSMERNGRIVE